MGRKLKYHAYAVHIKTPRQHTHVPFLKVIRFTTFETDNFFHLCSMKTYRKPRNEYRSMGNGYYHFCTDGWKEGNIFNTVAQYAYGMVLIGLISIKYAIVIYDFTLMPNHIQRRHFDDSNLIEATKDFDCVRQAAHASTRQIDL